MNSIPPQNTRAILVVHGVGKQNPGETTEKLIKGISRVSNAVISRPAGQVPEALINGVRLKFYEVYWADLLKGDITSGTFSFTEFQGISWFPWLNRRKHVNPPGRYAAFTTYLWTCLLPFLTIMLIAPFYGARMIAAIFDKDFRERTKSAGTEGSFWQQAKRQANKAAHGRTVLEDAIDEFGADVFNYVNSAGQARFPDGRAVDVPEPVQQAYCAIIQRFRDRLAEAAQQCDEVQIVAHSLGTVVTYHGLFGLQGDETPNDVFEQLEQARRRVSHLYTIGSPLEKIAFFWPKLIKPKVAPGSLHIVWDNFVSWFDPVAGVLKHFDQWGRVRNRRLLGGGFVSGHVVYERSRPFLEKFVEGIGGGTATLAETRWERIRDWLVLFLETFLAPALLLFITLLGGAIVLAVLLAVPWMISLLFRPDFMPQLNPVIFDRFAFGYAAFLILIIIFNSYPFARKVHSFAWCPEPDTETG